MDFLIVLDCCTIYWFRPSAAAATNPCQIAPLVGHVPRVESIKTRERSIPHGERRYSHVGL